MNTTKQQLDQVIEDIKEINDDLDNIISREPISKKRLIHLHHTLENKIVRLIVIKNEMSNTGLSKSEEESNTLGEFRK